MEPLVTPSNGHDAPSVLVEFVAQLGRAMNAAGAPVGLTTDTLRRVAARYGAEHTEVLVLPTMLVVRLGAHGDRSLAMSSTVNLGLRLDQIGAVFALADRAVQAAVEPADGLAQLADIWLLPARLSPAVRTLGHAVLAVGLGLIMTPSLGALAYAAALGLLVGVLKLVGNRSRVLGTLMPIAAALLVGSVVFAAARAGRGG